MDPHIFATYMTLMGMAEVLEETRRNNWSTSGKQLAKLFMNRTFHTKAGDFTIDEGGERTSAMAITHHLNVMLIQDGHTTPLRQVAVMDWPGVWPVLSRPVCGFHGEKCGPSHVPQYVMGFGGSFIVIFITFMITYVRLAAMHYAHRNWCETGNSDYCDCQAKQKNPCHEHLSFRETTIVRSFNWLALRSPVASLASQLTGLIHIRDTRDRLSEELRAQLIMVLVDVFTSEV
ncbi:hypothetical protein BV898_19812 [Hypsibius exemplaris]|uniref:Receptor ligand binding region domain-containing protein n=1 Tax=Hypsibius exemplaris TaxID=2072580 RepID=A0A9X6NJL8_HYPEX|nr:hypothetical protein BV898_19812 [Hypsibius exemplaris]